jgi:hypothetical protein
MSLTRFQNKGGKFVFKTVIFSSLSSLKFLEHIKEILVTIEAFVVFYSTPLGFEVFHNKNLERLQNYPFQLEISNRWNKFENNDTSSDTFVPTL